MAIATILDLRLRRGLVYFSRYLPISALFGLAAFVLLWRLDRASLHNWDEAIYAQIAKEILQTGEWITLHWEFNYWIDKPPLLMWVTASFFRWFGITEFWARAASAFSGVGLVLTTYFIGKLLYDRYVGFVSAIILLTSLDFVKWARNGMADVMLTLFIYLAVYSFIKAERESSKWWYLTWLAIALAIMLKGLVAFIAPVAIILVLLFNGRLLGILRSRDFWIGVGLAIVIATPWHLLMYMQFGQEFIEKYLLYQISYATTVLDNHSGNALFYFEKIGVGFAPWSALAVFGIWSGLKENCRGLTRSRILLAVIIPVLAVYSVSQTKLSTYAVPVYPSLAILTAGMLSSCLKENQIFVMAGLALGFCLTALVMLPSLQAVLVIGVMAVLVLLLGRSTRRASYSLLSVMFGCLIIISVASVRPLYSEGKAPIARLAQSVANAKRSGHGSLIIYSNLWAPSALFYSDRPINEVRDSKTLADLVGTQARDIILWEDDRRSLANDFQITVLVEEDGLTYAEIRKE